MMMIITTLQATNTNQQHKLANISANKHFTFSDWLSQLRSAMRQLQVNKTYCVVLGSLLLLSQIKYKLLAGIITSVNIGGTCRFFYYSFINLQPRYILKNIITLTITASSESGRDGDLKGRFLGDFLHLIMIFN